MVPASTLRRNEATIAGMTTSTPNRMAPATMMVFIFGYRREKGSTQGCYGATAAGRVHVCDANEITTANPDATRAIIRGKVCEQLNELAVDVDGNEAISVRIEARDG